MMKKLWKMKNKQTNKGKENPRRSESMENRKEANMEQRKVTFNNVNEKTRTKNHKTGHKTLPVNKNNVRKCKQNHQEKKQPELGHKNTQL
jgi:hypothetical protein